MKSLRVFMWFHRPERYFHKLSYKLENLPVKINELNKKRMQLQRRISSLSSLTDVCKTCKGKCCMGDYNHFTQVDLLIRMYSDKPITNTGSIWAPKKFTFIVTEKLKEIMSFNSNKNNMSSVASVPTEAGHCPNLDSSGCTFIDEDRPIRCLLWTCQAMRNSLPADKLEELGLCTKELGEIPLQVLNEYRTCSKFF